jgi:hypothetical protein
LLTDNKERKKERDSNFLFKMLVTEIKVQTDEKKPTPILCPEETPYTVSRRNPPILCPEENPLYCVQKKPPYTVSKYSTFLVVWTELPNILLKKGGIPLTR